MTNSLKMSVYLAGPIDGVAKEDSHGWREQIKDALPDIDFLDPLRRDYKEKDTGDIVWADEKFVIELVENDKMDVRNSDVVLVYHDRPSVGTSMEILYAFDRGIYVLTVGCTGKPLSPWITYHSTKIVNSLDEAIEELTKLSEDFGTYEDVAWDDEI